MDAQIVITATLVIGCTLYAAWALMPAAPRRGIATLLLKLPLPGRLASGLQKHLAARNGCGCDGCDAGMKAPAPGVVHTIRFHPRVKR